MQGDALRAKEQFPRAQYPWVRDTVKRVAKNHVHKLIDEQGRRPADAAADQVHKTCFQRLMCQQMVAESDQNLPIFPRVSVSDAATGRRGSRRSALCKLRSAGQASGGGSNSGLARYALRKSSVTT